MPLDELFIRNHQDRMFEEPKCAECGCTLPDDSVDVEGMLFCSEQCAEEFYDRNEPDPADNPEAIAFQSVIDAQEDDPRDIDPEDLLDDEDYGLRD